MIPLADYHVHTAFCDGKNTPEEMVEAALAQGMTAIGFSGHSHTGFDESWCMSQAGTAAYRAEIARLKAAYAGRIRVLCGVEQDYFSDASTADYDYVIGGVHYVQLGGEYVPVDESAEILRAAAAKHFGGDIYGVAEAYFRTVADVCDKTGCDVIGHFDLIAKFNEGGALFDEAHPRYVVAWQSAADRLLACGKPFELNTGAMFRGCRSVPYPAPSMQDYLAARGASFLLSGDAHSTQALRFRFDVWGARLEGCGVRIADAPR